MNYLAHRKPFLHISGVILAVLVSTVTLLGQARNNPYSPSPARKGDKDVSGPVSSPPLQVAFVTEAAKTPLKRNEPSTVVPGTPKKIKTADTSSLPPTETYKVGVGDVLFVNLKNTTQGSGYYTVRPNGTIDYPLAGENVIVADRTVDNIENILASGIALFPDPQVEVKVREYASHKITVSGNVERPGEKSLQREAIPLFVIRAEAVVNANATRAIVTRAPLVKPENYDLGNAATDNVLIYPGNSVEFVADARKSEAAFFILSGEVLAAGQKTFTRGLTLYQAVIVSGGTKGNPKKAVIKRKNDKGMLASTEHNLRSIKEGKSADPEIYPGDVIEVKN